MNESKDRAALRAIVEACEAIEGAHHGPADLWIAAHRKLGAFASGALAQPDPAAELAEALRFYATRDSWKEIETGIGMFASDAERDSGATARAALAKYEGSK